MDQALNGFVALESIEVSACGSGFKRRFVLIPIANKSEHALPTRSKRMNKNAAATSIEAAKQALTSFSGYTKGSGAASRSRIRWGKYEA